MTGWSMWRGLAPQASASHSPQGGCALLFHSPRWCVGCTCGKLKLLSNVSKAKGNDENQNWKRNQNKVKCSRTKEVMERSITILFLWMASRMMYMWMGEGEMWVSDDVEDRRKKERVGNLGYNSEGI